MNLSDFATDLTASNRFVKAALGGFAGAGKSETGSRLVAGIYRDLGYTKPVLVIDNEKGSRFLIPMFKKLGIPALVKDTTSLDDVLTAFEFLKRREIDFIFIDSLTKVWYRYVRQYMADQGNWPDGKPKKQWMELQDWGKVMPKWQETFSDAFVAAEGSVVFTGRGGFTYEKEEDTEENGRKKKGQFVKSGVKMKLAGETPFEPDLNIWMEQKQQIDGDGKLKVWREAQIMKDRSGLIDGQTFINPTYDDFRPFVQYLAGVSVGKVAGESSSRNLAPSEERGQFIRKTERQIALEEIGEEMYKLYPSQSKDDKLARGELTEKLFGSRAWTAVENLSLEKLQVGRNELWKQSRGHEYGAGPDVPHPNGTATPIATETSAV